jgi:hypothetical protein
MPAEKRESLPFQQVLRAGLAVVFGERRLVVEQFELRRSADHMQENDALGPGREMGARGSGIGAWGSSGCILAEQAGERDAADAHAGALEERAASEGQLRIVDGG